MKCSSCKEDIPSKFAHALTINQCPLCGSEIMPAALQTIILNLKQCMADASDFKEEVEDYLFSNYSLKRINENEIVIDKHDFERQQPVNAVATPNGRGKGISVKRDENAMAEDMQHHTPQPVHKKSIDFIRNGSRGAARPEEFQGYDEEYGEINGTQEPSIPLNRQDKHDMSGLFVEKETTQKEMELQKLRRMQGNPGVIKRG